MSAERLPRVVVLDHTAELGGAELALVRLLDAVGSRARVTTVLFSDGPLAERLRARGHETEVVPLAPGLASLRRHDLVGMALSPLRLVPFVCRVARLVRRLDADVVHTTSLKADLVGLAVATLARRPIVWHVHDRIAPDYLPRPVVGLVRWGARHVSRVIVNSEATAATLPGAAPLAIAPPGLAPDQLRAKPRPRPAGPPTVGLVGRISPTKDQLTFVRAAASVIRDHPTARFRIIGSAAFGAENYERQVREEVSRLGLDGALSFIGFVADVPAVLDELSLCVHTSSIPEPFGQAVVEAMSRGVPVVATSGGGVDEIMRDGSKADLGWLVPAGSPETLAAVITAALLDPDEAEQRGRRAWQSVRTRYPVAHTADVVLRVWQEVSGRPGR